MSSDRKGLIGRLYKLGKRFGDAELKLCFEASCVGFWLQQDVAERVYRYEVVSPSSVPRRAGKSVKTDRIDAAELAEYYANGLFKAEIIRHCGPWHMAYYRQQEESAMAA